MEGWGGGGCSLTHHLVCTPPSPGPFPYSTHPHPHTRHIRVPPQGYDSRKFMFQGVHDTICYGPCEKGWASNEPRINQIVFIGRNLDRKALMEGFRCGKLPPRPLLS